MGTKDLGKLGENLAAKYLQKKGYKILERNWKTPPTGSSQVRQKEIDIIARKDRAIIFVEVKTLAIGNQHPNRFLPEERIGPQKRKVLLSACKYYLFSKKIPLDTPWQIDVISVEANLETNESKIYHFANEIY